MGTVDPGPMNVHTHTHTHTHTNTHSTHMDIVVVLCRKISREMKMYIHIKTYRQIFTAVLFITTKK